jgi:hypothetical protein
MTVPDTSPAPNALVARAETGPHNHWSTFDLHLEGARYQKLHDLVSSADFDQGSAVEVIAQILAFSRGYGYGQADSFLSCFGHPEAIEEDAEAELAHSSLFSSYDETEYFDYVTKSELILKEAAATDEAKVLIRDLTVDALDAFCDGRDRRIEKTSPAAGVRL